VHSIKKLPPATRAKYALIRIRNIIQRFPQDIRKTDPVARLLLSVSEDLWELNKETAIDIKDVLMMEATCDDLEYILNTVYGDSNESKD
jgi:hypothetical protein